MRGLVSVIIPAYNAARFLPRAIDSVLRQTYSAVEIIVVDDGSTDSTAVVCRSYSDQVRYLHQENRGVSVARNLGIRVSKGEYLAFLDADDEWYPEFLDVLVGALNKYHDVGAATSGRYFVYADHQEQYDMGFADEFKIVDYYKAVAKGPNIVCIGSAVYRRPLINAVGGFVPWLKQAEDTEFYIRLSLHTRWYVSTKPLMNRYFVDASVTYQKTVRERIQEAFTASFMDKISGLALSPDRLFFEMYFRKKYRRLAPSKNRYGAFMKYMHHFFLGTARGMIKQHQSREFLPILLRCSFAASGISFRWIKYAIFRVAQSMRATWISAHFFALR